MRFYLLLALVPAAAFAAVSAAGAVAATLSWPAWQRRFATLAAAERARGIACLRILPGALGLLAAWVVTAVFVRYEPRDTTEEASWVLLGAAAAAGLLWARAAVHGFSSLRLTRHARALLRTSGRQVRRPDGAELWIIETPYPIAAVLGVFETHLLLSARIVRECSATELESVIRHEIAHIRRRDNLIQAAMRYLPDPLALTSTGREMQRAWAAAAEEAADDEAAGAEPARRTELASALVRVARMADGPPPRWMPALAFFEGTNLDTRVRRLLSGAPAARRGMGTTGLVAAALLLCAGALTNPLGSRIHGVMEIAVNLLP